MIDPLELAGARSDIAAYFSTGANPPGGAEITVSKRTATRTSGGRTTYTTIISGPYPVVVTAAPRQDVRMAPQVEAVTSVWLRLSWDVAVANADQITLTYLETGEQRKLEVVSILKRSFTLQQIIECKEIG